MRADTGDRPRLPDGWLEDRLREHGIPEDAIPELVKLAEEHGAELRRRYLAGETHGGAGAESDASSGNRCRPCVEADEATGRGSHCHGVNQCGCSCNASRSADGS